MSKDLDEKVDQLEAAMDPNTVISIGGYNFTPAKLMVAGAIVSSVLGTLYGAFEVYKDYQSMKEAIETYVAPDLSAINERLSVIQKQMESTVQSVDKTTEYTNEIKNDLKSDIRRLESVVESVERSSKQSQREADQAVKEVNRAMNQLERESEQNLRAVRREVDDKIKKALDNPLAN
jgi:DNA anti-recombination protein RmuC